MKLTLAKIAGFISASSLGGVSSSVDQPKDFSVELVAHAYSIDSRTIGPGELFFAVKGERLDGHDFVVAALEKGAVGAVVRQDQLHRYADKTRLLAVEDTLGCAAGARYFSTQVVGKTAGWCHRLSREDHYKRGNCPRAQCKISRTEVGRQL